MNMQINSPITVLYRGDLKDTATLVGLVQSRAIIELIAYTGPLEAKSLIYLKVMNRWLKSKGQPTISIHPNLTLKQIQQIPEDPLVNWNWGLQECRAALKMAGLPLPN